MKFTKKNGGFTLVELIVVIAILAILAAIAVPAYSGYIKKANEAGDQQLLAAVNTAFAAACLENNEDMLTISSYPSIPLNADKTINFAGVKPAAYADAFKTYFGGNATAAFKTFTSIVFDSAKGVFVDGATESISVKYGGNMVNISGAAAQKLNSSTFGTTMGAENLLGQVTFVADSAATNDTILGIVSSGENMTQIAEGLGMNVDQFGGVLDTAVANKVAAMKKDPANEGKTDAELGALAFNQVMANSAVLHAAQNTSSKESITALLGTGKPSASISAGMDTGSAAGLSDAAVAYAMVTAYAQYTKNETLIAQTQNPYEVTNLAAIKAAMDSAEFQSYINSDQGSADLDGYLSAMDMINSAANTDGGKNTGAVTDILANGYSDPALLDLLNGLGGK